jgi:large subunit ribosomal protein L2
MAYKKRQPAKSSRFALYLDTSDLTKIKPVKKLTKRLKKTGGRNNRGRVTARHRGGGHKRLLRQVCYRRQNKENIQARVEAIEYDPNRQAHLARLVYADGDREYILASVGLEVGHSVLASSKADLKPGNALPLANIPVGMVIHNVELTPGKGGQLARGAGSGLTILSKEGKRATIKLPSGEHRLVPLHCWAVIGQVSNPEAKQRVIGKAGRVRHLGRRPKVRGVAMHPGAHPHGGGEGRSGIGMPSPKSKWGKPTLGKKTRKRKKYSDHLIIKSRK